MPLWALNFLRPFVRFACRVFFRIDFRGQEYIPLEGPLIITPNHVTYADPFWVSIPVRRRIFYMTWNKVFEIPILASLARMLGAFPVRLDAADRAAVERALRLLQKGLAVMIFPEGGRSDDGRLRRFRFGAFRLAIATGAPLLPVTINGGLEVWPRKRLLPRTGTIRVEFHPPIYPAVAGGADPEQIRQETVRLASAVRALIESTLNPAPEPRLNGHDLESCGGGAEGGGPL